MDNYRSYAFRRFKRELTYLSRLHWVFSYSVGFVSEYSSTKGLADPDRLMDSLPVTNFEAAHLNISVGEFRNEAAHQVDHLRLLLLVKACANMEDYLHRMAQIWAVTEGYFAPRNKERFLDRRGEAIIKPALSSNLESSLSYLAVLMQVSFDSHAGLCGKAYQLRCLAGHNGGIVDSEAVRTFPGLVADIDNPIRLTWSQLRTYLKAIESASTLVENSIPSQRRLKSEIMLIAAELASSGYAGCANEPKVRSILKSRYSFNTLPDRKHLRAIIAAI